MGGGKAEGGVNFYILYFNIFIYGMKIERGQRDTKRKHYCFVASRAQSKYEMVSDGAGDLSLAM